MSRATAVIGSAFGDCGKGLVTDYCAAANPKAVVVRYNGGAQAGHTVCTPDGRRHVFSHFGAGSFVGNPTYLSRFFIVNPRVWAVEAGELRRDLGHVPALYVDNDAIVTTPYDMALNVEIERSRGAHRHGSCGIGVNETVTRFYENVSTTILAGDLYFHQRVLSAMDAIRKDYVPRRLSAMGVTPSREMETLLQDDTAMFHFAECLCTMFCKNAIMVDSDFLRGQDLIFEGAQGLLLDQDHHYFPHVTRSKTGMHNVRRIMDEVGGVDHVDAIYVTRTYMTRHGAGPFRTEDPTLSYHDDTNAEGEFQGKLRFGHLDTFLLFESINRDLKDAGPVRAMLAVTHVDQIKGTVPVETSWGPELMCAEDLVSYLFTSNRMERGLVSHGPCRTDVEHWHQPVHRATAAA